MKPLASVRQLQLALLLSGSHVPFVIVGGTARLLRGSTRLPADLDLVVGRADAGLLRAALLPYSTSARAGRCDGSGPWRVITSWSPVDVFVEDDLPSWHTVEVDGTELRAADE